MNNTGHALFDPVPSISKEQARADRDSFIQMCRSAGFKPKRGNGSPYTEDEKAEIGAEALFLLLDGFTFNAAARRLEIHPMTLRKIIPRG